MGLPFDKSNRIEVRKQYRKRQRQVGSATVAAGAQVENNLIGRFDRLFHVKRFLIGWLLLVVLIITCTVVQTLALNTYYQTIQPVGGGIYNEGIVGNYSNTNPIYASGAVDVAVSRLLFAGLLKYDSENNLTGDLANGYSVDTTGRHYTVLLKKNLSWQDGRPLTSADVVFTYKTIQNPDTNSPLEASWQGITITALDESTVRFDLPNTLTSFPYSLTTGLIPEHILKSTPANQLRASVFNTTQPIGSGPFSWQTIQSSGGTDPAKSTTSIALQPFKKYNGGVSKLDSFIVRAYPSNNKMITAFKNRELTAMAGLTEVPAALSSDKEVQFYNFPSTAELMTFFKTSEGVLSDVQVRQALVKGADTATIIKGLPFSARPVTEPLIMGQLGFDSKYQQSTYDSAAANTLLDTAGWVVGNDGIRSKDGHRLTFRLYAQDTSEDRYVLKKLATNWKTMGVEAVMVLQQPSDFQTTLEYHTYDALLYGISIGNDPDVFAYWDSSQADVRAVNRLNFSEYKSTAADAALEAGRTRSDPALRVIKYRPFLQAWQSDAPALGLYQPRFLYITRGNIYGLKEQTVNADSDRYNSVSKWEIHTARVTN